MSETLTPKMLAEEFGTDAKTIRKFLRSLTSDRAGKGGRWAIDATQIETLRERFENWGNARATVFMIDDEN